MQLKYHRRLTKWFYTHLSAFLCSDVFLKGDHIRDGLDGHQVNA